MGEARAGFRGRLLLLVLVPLALVLGACGESAEEKANRAPVYTEADAGTTIAIAKGAYFAVELEANPSTGYEWTYQAPDGVTMTAFEMLPPAEGTDDMVGVPQPYKWTFEVDEATGGKLVFTSVPPGGGEAETTLEFELAPE